MRFMIEIFAEHLEADPSSGVKMWDRYPFEVDGKTAWIKPEDLTRQELTDMAREIKELGAAKNREGDALALYRKVKQAGIHAVIDGGKS